MQPKRTISVSILLILAQFIAIPKIGLIECIVYTALKVSSIVIRKLEGSFLGSTPGSGNFLRTGEALISIIYFNIYSLYKYG